MSGSRACRQCGAVPASPEATVCAFCGSALAAPPSATEGQAGARRTPTRAEKIAALESDPRYGALFAGDPPRRGPSWVPVVLIGALLAVVIATTIGSVLTAGPLLIAPVAIALVIAWMFVRAIRRQMRVRAAPLERIAAVVVGKRTVERRAEDGDTVLATGHQVEIEDRAGARRTLKASDRVGRALAEGDAGIAFVRERTLVDFRAP